MENIFRGQFWLLDNMESVLHSIYGGAGPLSAVLWHKDGGIIQVFSGNFSIFISVVLLYIFI